MARVSKTAAAVVVVVVEDDVEEEDVLGVEEAAELELLDDALVEDEEVESWEAVDVVDDDE